LPLNTTNDVEEPNSDVAIASTLWNLDVGNGGKRKKTKATVPLNTTNKAEEPSSDVAIASTLWNLDVGNDGKRKTKAPRKAAVPLNTTPEVEEPDSAVVMASRITRSGRVVKPTNKWTTATPGRARKA